jgi:hypothetical protein
VKRAIAAPQLAPGTINLSGTPTGSGTLMKDGRGDLLPHQARAR